MTRCSALPYNYIAGEVQRKASTRPFIPTASSCPSASIPKSHQTEPHCCKVSALISKCHHHPKKAPQSLLLEQAGVTSASTTVGYKPAFPLPPTPAEASREGRRKGEYLNTPGIMLMGICNADGLEEASSARAPPAPSSEGWIQQRLLPAGWEGKSPGRKEHPWHQGAWMLLHDWDEGFACSQPDHICYGDAPSQVSHRSRQQRGTSHLSKH